MTLARFEQYMLTSRVWTFLAIFWVIRGVDLVLTGIGQGYVWLKHGFADDWPGATTRLPYSQWVKLACFGFGVLILVRQYRYKKAQRTTVDTGSDVP